MKENTQHISEEHCIWGGKLYVRLGGRTGGKLRCKAR